MSTNILDDANIIEWHITGWFNGSYCALAILALFLAIPGFFERSLTSKMNAILVFLALMAVIIRPTRLVYSDNNCYSISIAYWIVNFIFTGVLFGFYGTRISYKYSKISYAIGTAISIIHLSTLFGYSNRCPYAVLMSESFSNWTFYAGGSLVLASIFFLSIIGKDMFKKDDLLEDKRLTRIFTVSQFSLFLSASFLLLSGIFSFTPFVNFRILFIFSAVYSATASQLAKLLYHSLHQDTPTIHPGDSSTFNRSNSK